MEGQTLSHYKVLEKLGGGGMGVVYKALDTKLNRHVALKFLPTELTRDDDARERFILEAQAASALDHPNICTIHEVDETPEGQLFIAMGYYEGETLKKRIERGSISVPEALDIAIQMAQGLAEAHAADIVHRDIKPANVMLTKNGLVKIVDFGIAKLLGVTGPTQTGTTLGTVSYMSPEQVGGEDANRQSDIWSLGAVFYEMLTGQQAFRGETHWAVMNSIRTLEPAAPSSLNAEVPAAVDLITARTLEKTLEKRWSSADEFVTAAKACQLELTLPISTDSPSAAGIWRTLLTPTGAAAALVLVAAVFVGFFWMANSGADARWARDEALPEIRRLVTVDDYAAAVALAEEAEQHIPDHPELLSLWPSMSVQRGFDTNVPGARVRYKPYAAAGDDWVDLGTTPIEVVRVPQGTLRWRIEHEGFETAEFILPANFMPPTLPLVEQGSLPDRMLGIAPSNIGLDLSGFNFMDRVPAPAYLVDKFEVTNLEFKQFVDAGGYENREFWTDAFIRDGDELSWEQAVSEFVDRTGRSGPSTWEVGTYPQGQEDYPVSGVSWFEAAAYAEFVGKSLPTVYHWTHAAGTFFAAAISPLSNVDSEGLLPVGTSLGVSPWGAYDMAGNVREWCLNEQEAEQTRYILGGSWADPEYLFTFPQTLSPFDRSETNGFRLVDHSEEEPVPESFVASVALPTRDYSLEEPVSDDVFQVYRDLFAYDPVPLEPSNDPAEESDRWSRQRVEFNAAYDDDRIPAYLFIPHDVEPPYQPILYFPGADAVTSGASGSARVEPPTFLMESGRAVLYPIYDGTYERNSGQSTPWPDVTRAYADWIIRIIQDARMSIDYLESRPDMDLSHLGYYGYSFGAALGPIILSLDQRFQAAVFHVGGFVEAEFPSDVDPFNFASRVTQPVLMTNGDEDFIFDLERGQRPLYNLLGTPPEQKVHSVYPGGHGVMAQWRNKIVQESLDWFDQHIGPVR